jgi:plastocyanin
VRIGNALLAALICTACASTSQAPALARQPLRTLGQGVHRHRHPRARRACHRAHRHCPKPHELAARREHPNGGQNGGPSPAADGRSPIFGPPAPVLGPPGSEPSIPAGAGEAPAGDTSPEPTTPARVQVIAKEWSFTLSRPEVPAGRVIVEFVNGGEDSHNLHLEPSQAGPEAGSFATSPPGTHTDQAFNMPAGEYTLFCSLPGHEAKGMKATLKVG